MAESSKRQSRMEIDVDRYQAMLDSIDLTPAHKEEVIRALWAITVMAIDLGLSIHPAPTTRPE